MSEHRMTGPEHYEEGNRLMREAEDWAPDEAPYLALVTAAQAHYTAANAAATALSGSADRPPQERREWLRVAAAPMEPMTPRQHAAAQQ